ncbi:hypothetical protein KAW65_01305 [candidate division WOR-3 bacterium]|nr:hypothetical protein [candidate division WOR-3 bacterium]
MECANNFIGLFALSSAICCHLISKIHFGVTKSWIANKWFWAGLFGNLPVLIAFLGHIFFSSKRTD